MGPGDIQELPDFEPFIPFRMTLASGSVVDVRQREGVNVTGAAMSIVYTDLRGELRLRLVSVPNISLVEPILDGPTGGRASEENT